MTEDLQTDHYTICDVCSLTDQELFEDWRGCPWLKDRCSRYERICDEKGVEYVTHEPWEEATT